MSFNNMRVAGLATGMDLYSMVNDLMRVRRMPVEKLTQQRQILQWQQEDLRAINNSLRTFRDKVFDMRLQGTYLAREATSSDESVVKVSANSSAVEGTYMFSVGQLARGSYLSSSQDMKEYKDTLATQFSEVYQPEAVPELITFKIANGSRESSLLEFDPANSSIHDVVKAINDQDLGVKATYDSKSNRFFMMSTKAGSDQDIRIIEDDQEFLARALKLNDANTIAGTSAEFSLNGSDFVTDTNIIAVGGITFNLQDQGDVTVNVRSNTDAIFNKITSFVNSYNETMATVQKKLTETRYRDYQPMTQQQAEQLTDKQIDQWEEKARSGLLRNDPMLSRISSSMRTAISSPVLGMGGNGNEINRLSAIGITTTSNYNSSDLVINEDKLRQAIRENPDEVMRLFTNNIDESHTYENDKDRANHLGIARRLYEQVNNTMKFISDRAGSGDSLSKVDNSLIGKSVGRVDKEISRWEARLIQIEDGYWRQFNTMEQAINKLNSQGMWLAQQMGVGSGQY